MIVFEYKNRESLLRFILAYVLNAKTHITRRYLSGVAPIRMHTKLARRLVDEGDLHMLWLHSGHQVPLYNAVKYLEAIKDRDSIPRLKKLFQRYQGLPNKSGRPLWQTYGPSDYIPQAIQTTAMKALLKILSIKEAKEFIKENLSVDILRYFCDRTMSVIANFAAENKLAEFATPFLKIGKEINGLISDKYSDVGSRNPYGYEDLVYAAYRLSLDLKEKEEALQVLIAEYNHPKAHWLRSESSFGLDRNHDHIDLMMCKIVDEDLTGDPKEQARIISLLEPQRFQYDMKYWNNYAKAYY